MALLLELSPKLNCPIGSLSCGAQSAVLLVNPCGEIVLRPKQFCNLSIAVIRPEDIPLMDDAFTQTGGGETFSLPQTFHEDEYHQAREKVLTDFEKGYIVWLVNRAGGNMSRAARIAGVDRTTLYRLIEKHGMERESILRER